MATKSSAVGGIHILFARRISDDRMVDAGNVPKGLACKCVCVKCGGMLIARQGLKRRPHFAHYASHECAGAPETAIHAMAKQVIFECEEILLPAWTGAADTPNPPVMWDDRGEPHLGDFVDIPSKRVHLQDIQVEVSFGDYRPDLVARDLEGELLIEIKKSHAVGDEKLRKIQSEGRRLLEIDLSGISTDLVGNTDLFRGEVLENVKNRYWLSHPLASDKWRLSVGVLKKKVEAENVRIKQERDDEDKRRRSHLQNLNNKGLAAMIYAANPYIGKRINHHEYGVGVVERYADASDSTYVVFFYRHGQKIIDLSNPHAGGWRLRRD